MQIWHGTLRLFMWCFLRFIMEINLACGHCWRKLALELTAQVHDAGYRQIWNHCAIPRILIVTPTATTNWINILLVMAVGDDVHCESFISKIDSLLWLYAFVQYFLDLFCRIMLQVSLWNHCLWWILSVAIHVFNFNLVQTVIFGGLTFFTRFERRNTVFFGETYQLVQSPFRSFRHFITDFTVEPR